MSVWDLLWSRCVQRIILIMPGNCDALGTDKLVLKESSKSDLALWLG